jgi:hypothetical protein
MFDITYLYTMFHSVYVVLYFVLVFCNAGRPSISFVCVSVSVRVRGSAEGWVLDGGRAW